jgi:hypothetical protein
MRGKPTVNKATLLLRRILISASADIKQSGSAGNVAGYETDGADRRWG